MENKLAHLQMIQGVITRMAGNSFLLKGWSVTIAVALFALAAANKNPGFVYLAYFPLLMFWCLDGFFLRQERLFRKLYDHVCALSPDAIDFSMDTAHVSKNSDSWLDTCRSNTLLIFHGTIFASVIVVMLIFIARA